MTFLIVRPKSKVEASTSAFQNQGLNALGAPLLDVKISTNSNCIHLLNNAQASIVIVTSTYAVEWLAQQKISFDLQACHLIGIGSSTAQALSQYNPLLQIEIAKPENSEGALQLPSLQKLKKVKVIILKGKGGRNVLPPELKRRGAQLICIDAYERVKLPYIESFEPSRIQCIIVTSIELAQAALSTFDKQWCEKLHWIVASERIKDYAVGLGITKIIVSKGASNDALVKCAQHLVHTGVVHV